MNTQQSVGKVEGRFVYPTVEAFAAAVKKCDTAQKLSSLCKSFRAGAGTYGGIHPFIHDETKKRECWKGMFEQARRIGAKYYKGSRDPFQDLPGKPFLLI